MNDDPWHTLNRLFAELTPEDVEGSPEWWAAKFRKIDIRSAIEPDGTLNINKMDALDKAWLDKNPRGEIDLDGDGGAEWLANQADNKNRRSG